MPEIQDSLDFPTVPGDHFLKTKKEYKNLEKQEIPDKFIKMN